MGTSRVRTRWPIAIALLVCAFPSTAGDVAEEAALLERIERSGRLDTLGESSSDRLRPLALLAPGDPPMLAFRYLEDRRRHRFGELDLMMDDAGH